MNTMNQLIVDFYSGKQRTHPGETLRESMTGAIKRAGKCPRLHSMAVFLYPTQSIIIFAPPSSMRSKSPNSRTDPELQAQLLVSLDMMLGFYGFERNNQSITCSNSWEERSRNWLRPGNHNHLRLTRILKSLSILGLKTMHMHLWCCLTLYVRWESGAISGTTMGYWKRALLGSWNDHAWQDYLMVRQLLRL